MSSSPPDEHNISDEAKAQQEFNDAQEAFVACNAESQELQAALLSASEATHEARDAAYKKLKEEYTAFAKFQGIQVNLLVQAVRARDAKLAALSEAPASEAPARENNVSE